MIQVRLKPAFFLLTLLNERSHHHSTAILSIDKGMHTFCCIVNIMPNRT